MKLKKIVSGQNFSINEDMEIGEIKKDSRLVKEGDIFFDLAKKYEKSVKNAENARKNGAILIFSDKNLPFDNVVKVGNIKKCFAKACANYYDNPQESLKFVGVTGTNGKTTCTHVISELLKSAGRRVATIGTMGIRFADHSIDTGMTTPNADELFCALAKMRDEGVEYVVMEVSAHAINQERVYGIKFDVAILTNITQDHLDYFGSMQSYRDCKLSFFEPDFVKMAVVCTDDESGRYLFQHALVPTVSYGLDNPSDVFAVNIEQDMHKTAFCLNMNDNVYDVETNLIGKYNIQNILASLTACSLLGERAEELVPALKYVYPVEGRFNVVRYNGKNIVVDYAHTPDGLENVLKTAREMANGKLYCVFGCGGNRDKDKRHKMGQIAEKYCDGICLTNDNPRFEEPIEIVRDIESGMQKEHFVELDRERAIGEMIKRCSKGDVLVVAGKGGEKYQIFNDEKRPYNDFDAINRCIEREKQNERKEFYGN